MQELLEAAVVIQASFVFNAWTFSRPDPVVGTRL